MYRRNVPVTWHYTWVVISWIGSNITLGYFCRSIFSYVQQSWKEVEWNSSYILRQPFAAYCTDVYPTIGIQVYHQYQIFKKLPTSWLQSCLESITIVEAFLEEEKLIRPSGYWFELYSEEHSLNKTMLWNALNLIPVYTINHLITIASYRFHCSSEPEILTSANYLGV